MSLAPEHLTPQEIFWRRERHYAVAIREEAIRMYHQYNRQRGPLWVNLNEAEQFPWCLAAERQLTAQRIAADRYRDAGNPVDNDDQKA